MPIKLLWDGILDRHPQSKQVIANNLIMILGAATARKLLGRPPDANVFLMKVATGVTLMSVLSGRVPTSILDLLHDSAFAAGVIKALETLLQDVDGYDPYTSGLGSKQRGIIK